jgi:ADP-ribosylglycohydrolase
MCEYRECWSFVLGTPAEDAVGASMERLTSEDIDETGFCGIGVVRARFYFSHDDSTDTISSTKSQV